MDICDTLCLGTPGNQALDVPLMPEQGQSMIDAAARKLGELLDSLRIGTVLASHSSRTISSAYYGPIEHDQRRKAEFLEECRSLERRACP